MPLIMTITMIISMSIIMIICFHHAYCYTSYYAYDLDNMHMIMLIIMPIIMHMIMRIIMRIYLLL